MNAPARRQFLKAGTSLAVLVALAPRGVRAAMGPNDKFDLLVRKRPTCSIRARTSTASATSASAMA